MGAQTLLGLLDDVAFWAGAATFVALLIARAVVPQAARHRLGVAVFLLFVGAIVTTVAHALDSPLARHLGAVALLLALARVLLIIAFDALPLLRETPRIVGDIVGALTYFVALLIVLRGFGVQLDSLVTTSALLTAVAGFALQDTLGNLAAGLAIQVQRPFAVGDWIEVQGSSAPAGKVLEINWRATTVLTLDKVEVTYPNALLAKTAVTTFTRPTAVARRNLFVMAPYVHAPDEVITVLLAAVSEAPGVLAEPAPSVVVKSFEPGGAQYWVRYFIDDYARRDFIDGAAWTHIWYAMRRAAIEIPYRMQTLFVHELTDDRNEQVASARLTAQARVLREVDILGPVPDRELEQLAGRVRTLEFAPGERVLAQGEAGSSLFVIASGSVTVHVKGSDGVEREVATLGAKSFFGEMSLLTGEPRSATVRAHTRVELYEIDHEMFRGVLMANEAIAQRMSALLEHRQAVRDEATRAAEQPALDKGEVQLFDRVKRFFRLG